MCPRCGAPFAQIISDFRKMHCKGQITTRIRSYDIARTTLSMPRVVVVAHVSWNSKSFNKTHPKDMELRPQSNNITRQQFKKTKKDVDSLWICQGQNVHKTQTQWSVSVHVPVPDAYEMHIISMICDVSMDLINKHGGMSCIFELKMNLWFRNLNKTQRTSRISNLCMCMTAQNKQHNGVRMSPLPDR